MTGSARIEAIAAKGRRHLVEAREQWERARKTILDCRESSQPGPREEELVNYAYCGRIRTTGRTAVQYGKKLLLVTSPSLAEFNSFLPSPFALKASPPWGIADLFVSVLDPADYHYIVEDTSEAFNLYRVVDGMDFIVDFASPFYVFHRNGIISVPPALPPAPR